MKIEEITKKLFLFFSNNEKFNSSIKQKLINKENIDLTSFEILLYSLRFCLQTSNCQNPDEFLFSKLISKDCEKTLKENYIPGNNTLDNIFVNNYYLIEDHLNNKAHDIGAYVCSCGFY